MSRAASFLRLGLPRPAVGTLQATALIHGAHLRLVGDGERRTGTAGAFLAAATDPMRRILRFSGTARSLNAVLTCFGGINMRAQADVSSALRTDTPTRSDAVWRPDCLTFQVSARQRVRRRIELSAADGHVALWRWERVTSSSAADYAVTRTFRRDRPEVHPQGARCSRATDYARFARFPRRRYGAGRSGRRAPFVSSRCRSSRTRFPKVMNYFAGRLPSRTRSPNEVSSFSRARPGRTALTSSVLALRQFARC
jgi:hypothetical protein